ncbi:MAG: PLP-dependent aspartate aminotransferase family protein [Gammaproteobacteria bacterium]|nr:PLP-dependent aspartate aminotransferase family protein [Gammaproteobacteria bacterium]MDH4253637.1 PLP-dependent aspartate aminotransferase family protein [Gammaproteobacteria bacterium]MDH5309753.1 PLP-dependent aspartate aminotransferase family protein [Gammaproteobacteria bacterium]
MAGSNKLKPETCAAQALHFVDPTTGAIVPGIQPSTTFARDQDYRLIVPSHSYARDESPSFDAAEAVLQRLENAADAMLFSSGMAAAVAVFQSLAPGDHVVAPRVMYWGLRNWLTDFCGRWGLELELFDPGDPRALAGTIRQGRTRLVWIETPSNPTWDVIDIAAAAELAHAAGAMLAVDSTAATPVLTRPLELGADLVMHSATKYLNGHGDVVAGALATAQRDEFWERLCRQRHDGGAIPGSFEAWLLQRGMRTLFLRVRQASASALRIAQELEPHPALESVLYPGLESHPGHAIARRQMLGGYGGMLSLRIRGGREAALAVANRCRVFIRATSLGGVESLIEHRFSIEGPTSPVPPDLLRLSIGVEAVDDLLDDLRQALA